MNDLKKQIESIIRRYERLADDMAKVRDQTNGVIDFGSVNDEPDLFIYKGIREIAEILGVEVNTRERSTVEYPMEYSIKVGKSKLYMIE